MQSLSRSTDMSSAATQTLDTQRPVQELQPQGNAAASDALTQPVGGPAEPMNALAAAAAGLDSDADSDSTMDVDVAARFGGRGVRAQEPAESESESESEANDVREEDDDKWVEAPAYSHALPAWALPDDASREDELAWTKRRLNPVGERADRVLARGFFGEASLSHAGTDEDQRGASTVRKRGRRNREQANKDMKKEAENFREIGSHENLVSGQGVQGPGGNVEIAMDPVDGGTMAETYAALGEAYGSPEGLDRESEAFKEYWAIQQHLTKGMLQGVAHLNDKGFTHGDIKPANAMVDAEGTAKLIDLGGAEKVGEEGVGTHRWASPNQLMGGGRREGDDTFTIGRMLQASAEDALEDDCRVPKNMPDRRHNPAAKNLPAEGLGPELQDDASKDPYAEFVRKSQGGDLSAADALKLDFFTVDLGLDEDQVRALITGLQAG